MPSTSPALFVNILPLMSGGPDPTKQSSSYQRFENRLFCGYWPPVVGINHDLVDCVIEHYVTPEEALPIEESMVMCVGTLKVLAKTATAPLIVRVKTLSLQCFPGDVSADSYEDHCPLPSHAQISVTGIVDRTQTLPQGESDMAWPSYELNLHVYDGGKQSLPLTLWILIPPTRRWAKTPLPRQNALVNVVGQIIGVKEDCSHLAVEQQAFDYINTRGTESATDASSNQQQSPAVTPTKRRRWNAYQVGASPQLSTRRGPAATFNARESPSSSFSSARVVSVEQMMPSHEGESFEASSPLPESETEPGSTM
ncbi:MAG: hypothetical protein M1837_007300 [Sclerophora amabilis]|nr:MAG: hypothetical protein M1837_007300 [Sclerophora amabilis]